MTRLDVTWEDQPIYVDFLPPIYVDFLPGSRYIVTSDYDGRGVAFATILEDSVERRVLATVPHNGKLEIFA